MTRDIKHSFFFPHSPEIVWACLTDSELIGEWLMKNDFQPVVGHVFQFHTKPQPGFDGNVYCEVLEVVPMEKLSYSWKGGPQKGTISLDSVVSWFLSPKENGTELRLEHTGFDGLVNMMASVMMSQGWKTGIANKLSKVISEYAAKKA